MPVNLDVHKIILVFLKTKTYQLLTAISFVCSVNLWFLTIYFFKHDLVVNHGYVIAGMVAFALAVSWNLITGATLLSIIRIVYIPTSSGDTQKDENEFKDTAADFILSGVILYHSLFLYLAYSLKWSFFTLLSSVFAPIAGLFILLHFVDRDPILFVRLCIKRYRRRFDRTKVKR